MTFDANAVTALVASVTSHAQALGIFESVNAHEPKSAPGSGLRYAVWAQEIMPLGRASGLSMTSGRVTLQGRIYGNMLQKPEDDVDPQILTAATILIGAYTGDFDFGDTVQMVDLLGAYGVSLNAQAGYITINSSMYRVMTITVPVIINDMWDQVG
jgi:hypothetical protein